MASDVGHRRQRGRQPNPRLVKLHRNYTVEEVARLFDLHRNTVRNWVKHGLEACDQRRPMLILGQHLAAFLQARRQRNKKPCGPGELYCVRCRVPRTPAGDMVDFEFLTATSGTLVGICPVCEVLMRRRASFAQLDQFRGSLEVTITKAMRHIEERPEPSVNCDFERETDK